MFVVFFHGHGTRSPPPPPPKPPTQNPYIILNFFCLLTHTLWTLDGNHYAHLQIDFILPSIKILRPLKSKNSIKHNKQQGSMDFFV